MELTDEAKTELQEQGPEWEDGNGTWELPDKGNDAKEELLPQGTEMEDVNKAPNLPTAKEELRQQGMVRPDKTNKVKDEAPEGDEFALSKTKEAPQGDESTPSKAKEARLKQGTERKDANRTRESLDKAKRERSKQGTAIPEERTMVEKILKATQQRKVLAKKQPPTLPPVGTNTCPAVEGGVRTQVTHPSLTALELNTTGPPLACLRE